MLLVGNSTNELFIKRAYLGVKVSALASAATTRGTPVSSLTTRIDLTAPIFGITPELLHPVSLLCR